jgi:hypothetical protein
VNVENPTQFVHIRTNLTPLRHLNQVKKCLLSDRLCRPRSCDRVWVGFSTLETEKTPPSMFTYECNLSRRLNQRLPTRQSNRTTQARRALKLQASHKPHAKRATLMKRCEASEQTQPQVMRSERTHQSDAQRVTLSQSDAQRARAKPHPNEAKQG